MSTSLTSRPRRWTRVAAAALALLPIGSVRAGARDNSAVTVPITIHGVHIFVEATVNHQPVTLVLDTGAGGDVITPEAAARLGLKPRNERVDVIGAGALAPPVAPVILDELGVGSATVKRQTAYLIPLPDALPCDGLLGTPFLNAWVITIDYEQSRLTLTPRKRFTPPADAEALPLTFEHNTPHIEASTDGCRGSFQVDTGAGDALTLFSPFVDRNHLREKYPNAIRTSTGRGVGGLLSGELARLNDIEIGKFRLLKPVVEFSRQTGGVFADTKIAGNLGGDVLDRFTVTLDYADKKLYLVPNGRIDTPFVGNRSGLGLDEDEGKFVVVNVIPNGPGDEAGVKPGDVVTEIDGKPISRLHAWDVRELLRRDPGSMVRLRLVGRDMSEREVTVTLRDIL